jgi:lipoprotein signal peptidase
MIFPFALIALAMDFASKSWATTLHQPLEAGPFTLAHVSNEALVLSLGAGALPADLIVLARLAIFAICAWVAARAAGLRIRQRLGFALIAVGGLGNLIDLIGRGGAVVDFIGIDPVAFLTRREGLQMFFNLADVFIVAGLLLVIPVIRSVGLRVQRTFHAWESRALGRLRSAGWLPGR